MGNGMLKYMAAGAVAGVAKGIVQESLLKREAGREWGRQNYRSQEAALDRDFRAGEAAKGRDLKRTGMLADAENQKARRAYETKTLEAGAQKNERDAAYQTKSLEAKSQA